MQTDQPLMLVLCPSSHLSVSVPDLLASLSPSIQFGNTQCRWAGERHRGAGQKQDGRTTGGEQEHISVHQLISCHSCASTENLATITLPSHAHLIELCCRAAGSGGQTQLSVSRAGRQQLSLLQPLWQLPPLLLLPHRRDGRTQDHHPQEETVRLPPAACSPSICWDSSYL